MGFGRFSIRSATRETLNGEEWPYSMEMRGRSEVEGRQKDRVMNLERKGRSEIVI
jgi:hypothetical protein